MVCKSRARASFFAGINSRHESLESVCFAILVGVSCDFVLHFSDAYCNSARDLDRHSRTKHALISMSPSILAAALTTIAAAILLLFASIKFFFMFGSILVCSLTSGLIGSMFIFLVLVDVFGPACTNRKGAYSGRQTWQHLHRTRRKASLEEAEKA